MFRKRLPNLWYHVWVWRDYKPRTTDFLTISFQSYHTMRLHSPRSHRVSGAGDTQGRVPASIGMPFMSYSRNDFLCLLMICFTISYSYGGWLRNPAPVHRWFIPLFIGFQPSVWWCRISLAHPQWLSSPRPPMRIEMGNRWREDFEDFYIFLWFSMGDPGPANLRYLSGLFFVNGITLWWTNIAIENGHL